MFIPNGKRGKYDRNIFHGNEEFVKVDADTDVKAYFLGDVIIGKITGVVSAMLYRKFRRNNFIPIQIFHHGVDYCGWVDENQIRVEA